MTAWILLPVSLSAFSITGLWTVYAMAVMNHHVCPVENWSYNESCSPDPMEQGGPKICCTLDDIPLISKCGLYPPESCLFSLIGNLGAFMVALICFLRYGQLLEQSRHSWVNTTTLITGCTNAAGLVVVGNFQVDHAKSLHYVGTGVAFTAGLLFVCLHCALSYHGAKTPQDLAVAYLRIVLATIAFVTLILTGVFFIHESSQLQHGAALFCPEEEGLMQNSFAWTKDGRKPLPTGRVLSAHREQSCQEQRMPSAIQVPLKGLKPFLGL